MRDAAINLRALPEQRDLKGHEKKFKEKKVKEKKVKDKKHDKE